MLCRLYLVLSLILVLLTCFNFFLAFYFLISFRTLKAKSLYLLLTYFYLMVLYLDLNVKTINAYRIMFVLQQISNDNSKVLSLSMCQSFLYSSKFMTECGIKNDYFPVMFNGSAGLSLLHQNDSGK